MHRHQLIPNTHKALNVLLIHPHTKPIFQAQPEFLIPKMQAKSEEGDDVQPICLHEARWRREPGLWNVPHKLSVGV